MTDEIINLIRTTLLLRADQISPETPIEAIARDSMDIVELIAVLTNTYKIAFRSQDIAKIKTVNDIISYVEMHHATPESTHPLDAF